MARMYPFPVREFTNESEESLYHLLRIDLPSEYSVLYGRRWTAVKAAKNPDVEVDFIIARPNGAILILEVKGGLWEHRDGYWHCYGNPVAAADDPVLSAVAQKHALVALLKSDVRWQAAFFPIGYAIALPDTPFGSQPQPPGLPAIMSNSDLPYLANWVEATEQAEVDRNGGVTCSEAMIDHLVSCLMGDYAAMLKDVLAADEQRLLMLTEEQRTLDAALSLQRRLAVRGCAGSGKTWMAIRHVRRLAALPDVHHILFTCFNLELGSWLQQQTRDIADKCDTVPFMELCEQHLQRAGLLAEPDGEKGPAYWEPMPAQMLDVLDVLPYKYDAIVVDEAQIFKPDWWAVLELMKADPARSFFYIFYDHRQRIYREVENEVPDADEPILLTVNVRNTANINRVVGSFLPEDERPDSNSVTGELVELGLYQDANGLRGLLRQCLHRLIVDGRVSPQDIIVLAPKRLQNSSLAQGSVGPYHLSATDSDDPQSIRWATIQGYRGMERKVVIVADFEPGLRDFERLLYCGITRATTKLIMLLSASVDPEVIANLRQVCTPIE